MSIENKKQETANGEASKLVRRANNIINSAGKDFETAFALYAQAAKMDDPEGMLRLALCYFEGRGTAPDEVKGLSWLQQAAQKGNSTAQYLLGCRRCNGDRMPLDKEEGLRWLHLAAEQKHPGACSSLGRSYLSGNIVPKDEQKAARYLSLAVAGGDSAALIPFAIVCKKGLGMPKDLKLALSSLHKAALWGIDGASMLLGRWYYFGECGTIRKDVALFFIKIAAKEGSRRVEAEKFIQDHPDLLNVVEATDVFETIQTDVAAL